MDGVSPGQAGLGKASLMCAVCRAEAPANPHPVSLLVPGRSPPGGGVQGGARGAGALGSSEGCSHWLLEAEPWLVWVPPSDAWVTGAFCDRVAAIQALRPPRTALTPHGTQTPFVLRAGHHHVCLGQRGWVAPSSVLCHLKPSAADRCRVP
ncbi:hypothetical protein mRhiFer1_008879 [Rhinolophus ferrumequinum]|uniref:Uncharacterized protein n=1 Tax=Rhinolophus ferrumequinum TaxID=59479 RepID=A0A7J8AFP3_RHIFE|nr:hypothetical protein mRhiFer1_008879 [Rhinolophus ferrumequinum]